MKENGGKLSGNSIFLKYNNAKAKKRKANLKFKGTMY